MGITSDACWFLLIKTLLVKNDKKREEALKNEVGGDEKHVFFFLGLIVIIVYWKWRILKVRLLKKSKYSQTSRKQPPKMSSLQV